MDVYILQRHPAVFDLLELIEKETGDRYYVDSVEHIKRRFFRAPTNVITFRLYYDCCTGEYQEINMYTGKDGSIFGAGLPISAIYAYLLGFLNGTKKERH